MRILVIGDVYGGVGLRALLDHLPELRDTFRPDLVVANAENAADGDGTSSRQAFELLEAGIDVLTGGNHSLTRPDFGEVLRTEPRVLRPHNFPRGDAPGSGVALVDTAAGPAAVINLLGAVFVKSTCSPFEIIDELIATARAHADHVLVDLHAEATSEKVAFARYVDGRVTVVVGTHTHVQTADARVLPGGTAYVTDLGMSGPHDSVIGVRSEIIVNRFLGRNTHQRFETAEGDVRVQGASVVADAATGRALSIETFTRGGG